MRQITHNIISFLLTGFLIFCFVSVAQSQQNIDDIKIVVTFDEVPTSYLVAKAPLKFNKKFAMSMQIDDALRSIYDVGFPVFEGGSLNGVTYPGMKYSDGCNNLYSFKMTSAILIFSGVGKDLLDDAYDVEHIQWPELDILVHNKWGIANHGIDSEAYGDVEFKKYSIARNRSYCRRKLYNSTEGGVLTSVFVNPNGEQAWTEPSFNLGNIVALKAGGEVLGSDYGGDVNLPEVKWGEEKYLVNRLIAENIDVKEIADSLANKSINGANYWAPIFTHIIGNQYPVEDFISDFNYIYDKYGSNGTDEILMTTDEEILDYLIVRELITVNEDLQGTKLTITFSGDLPDDLLYYALSLPISSDKLITNIEVEGTETFSVSETGTNEGLVNISWNGKIIPDPEVLAENYTTIAESSNTQYDAWIAMDYVYTLIPGEKRVELVDRLCGLEGVSYDEDFCKEPEPLFEITGNTVILEGDSTILTASAGMDTYLWSTNETTQSVEVHPSETTNFTVQGTLNDIIYESEVTVVKAEQNLEIVKVLVTFDEVPVSYTLSKAPLKYNKQFALSFQVDDGTLDIYNKVYPYFSNLFYTDGCGNDIKFTASSSVYCFQEPGETGPDMHDPTDPSFDDDYLAWENIEELYNQNYGIFNHGVSGKPAVDDNWMNYSVGRNRSFLRRRLYSLLNGRETSNAFVCPNQLQEWTQPAFDNGYKIALNKKDNGPIGLNGGNVNATTNWYDQQYIKRREAHRVVPVPAYVDELFNQSVDGANYWGSIFTHLIVDIDEDEHYPVGIFQSDFANIAATYGKGSLDNILVTTDEEIYDYLNIRDGVELVENWIDNTLEITLSGTVANDLKYYAMSLVVESETAISSIDVQGSDAFSKDETKGLINFSWDDQIVPNAVDLAESFTSNAELSNTQYDAWIAMDYVYTLPMGDKKVELVNRLCGLEGNTYEEGFCDITLDTIVQISGDTIICLGDNTELTATLGMDTYSWSDGQATQIIEINPTETTVYSVTSSLNGNISSDEVTVVVNPVPNIVSHSNETVNHIFGINDTLWVSTMNDENTYLWDTGSKDSALIVSPAFTSDYYVDVSNQYECYVRQEFNVIVEESFQFNFDSVCLGGITNILNTSTYPDSIISVSWDLNSDGVFDDAVGNEVVHEFTEAGNHLVGMRSVLFEGGFGVVFNVVPVGDYPKVDFGVDNTCIPGSTNFEDKSTVIVGENIEWTWDLGDGGTDVSSYVSHTYFTSGEYDVKLVVTSSIGCKDSLVKQIAIGESPDFEILNENNDILYANDTTKIDKNDSLYVTIQNAATYDSIIWNNEINRKYFFVTEEGAFNVDVYNTVCSNSRVHYMKFNSGGGGEPTTNEVMNLFTPNGDGYNDNWIVNDPNISGDFKVNIYNRFGNLVYSSDNYNNDWLGTFNDVALPQATYYYVIEDSEGTIFKGPVTILR